jgi:nitroreductase
MDFEQAVRGRRSVRAYRDESVPAELLREVIEEARWAPSWANAQDWNVIVVTGQTLHRLKSGVSAQAKMHVPTRPDIAMPGEWPLRLQERMAVRGAAPAVAGQQPPQPPEGRTVWEAWGAPALLLLAVDTCLSAEYACFDAGLLAESLCLTAFDKGLGTCIEAMIVRYPLVLHQLLPGTAGLHFVAGIALGYVDEASPANSADRARVDIDEFVTWVE